ncbi:hypothetical protein, partial [Aliikangiella maris]
MGFYLANGSDWWVLVVTVMGCFLVCQVLMNILYNQFTDEFRNANHQFAMKQFEQEAFKGMKRRWIAFIERRKDLKDYDNDPYKTRPIKIASGRTVTFNLSGYHIAFKDSIIKNPVSYKSFGPNVNIYSDAVFERYYSFLYANRWRTERYIGKNKEVGSVKVIVGTYWRPYKDLTLNFTRINQFLDEIIEHNYKLKTKNENQAFSLLEDSYKVIKKNSVIWLVKDIYKYFNLKRRIFQTVLSEQLVLNIEFTRSTFSLSGPSAIGECDMIENWNQAEKAFMENFEIELTEEFLSFQKEFWQTY